MASIDKREGPTGTTYRVRVRLRGEEPRQNRLRTRPSIATWQRFLLSANGLGRSSTGSQPTPYWASPRGPKIRESRRNGRAWPECAGRVATTMDS